jgi:hypothetical protein
MPRLIPIAILLVLFAGCGAPRPEIFGSALPPIAYDATRIDEPVFGGGNELTAKRTYRAKFYDNGASTIGEFHGGEIHYKGTDNQFYDVDFTNLEDMGLYWRMVKGNYKLFVAKQFKREQLIRFDNVYDGANHSIYYEPKMLAWVNATDLSDMQVFRNQQYATGTVSQANGLTVIRYEDAFGDGINFEITLNRFGFEKKIVIEARNKLELPPTANHKLVALFKYQGDGLAVRKLADSSLWDQDGYFESEDGFELSTSTGRTLIRPAYIEDSATSTGQPNRERLKVFWRKYNGSLWQAKVLPKAYLNNAVYPVRADTVTAYPGGAGDGDVYSVESTWANARDTADTLAVENTSANTNFIGTQYYSSTYRVFRGFFPVDTSGIDDTATISSSTFVVNISAPNDGDNDDQAYITLASTTMRVPTALETDDFHRESDTEMIDSGTRKDITSVGSGWEGFVLNAAGRAHIVVIGWTKIMMREGHDLENSAITGGSNKHSSVQPNTEYSTNDPYLLVDYTTGDAAAVTDGLKIYSFGDL